MRNQILLHFFKNQENHIMRISIYNEIILLIKNIICYYII